MYRVTVAVLASLLLGLACGPGGSSAPAGAAKPGAPAQPAAGSAPQSDAAYRQQVIDAARAEGVVNAAIQTTYTAETIQQLEAALEREYGVKIKINFTPVGNYAQRGAELLSEVAANVTPSYDLYQASETTQQQFVRADAVEKVNWTPLLQAGTPAGMVSSSGAAMVVYTDHFGLMYDPNVVPDSEAPRSLKDLANPRWRGRFMMFGTPTSYLPHVLTLGREQALAAMKAAVQNSAGTDTLPGQFTRYTSKEYPMIMVTGSFFLTAQLRGIPARFTPLDVSTNSDHQVAVAARAAHPNAAKLLAALLAGPEGQRISFESVGVGSRYYEGSVDDKLEQEARAAGFPSFSYVASPDALAFALSPDGEELGREMDRILKGG